MSAYEPPWISLAQLVEVVGAGAAGRGDVAADEVVRRAQLAPCDSSTCAARSARSTTGMTWPS